MKKRTYIVKQEKGNDIASVAYKVTDMLYKNSNEIDVDPVLPNEDEYEVSLTDRYWEVRLLLHHELWRVPIRTYSCNTDLTLLGAMLQFESAVGFKGNNAP